MNRAEVDILEEGARWLAAGERVVLATVARTWGSSPRQPGALMVMSEHGRLAGSVSGGCIEEELLARVTSTFPAGLETLEYDSDTTRTLPCGGRLLLVLEPLAGIGDLGGLIGALRAGGRVLRRLDLGARSASWTPAAPDGVTRHQGEVLEVVYEPAWRLLVVGAGELASWVCRFGELLGYAIEVCEPRPEYRAGWRLDTVAVEAAYPDDFLAARTVDPHTAIVALTHDPKVDDLAMLEALRTRAFYVGALGSSRTTRRRAERLAEHFAVTAEDLARIRGPIGIDLNTRKPQEIALAVLAEITAARNRVALTSRRLDA